MKKHKGIAIVCVVMFAVMVLTMLSACHMEHTWVEKDVPATCTERGIRGSLCTKCGYYTDKSMFLGGFKDNFKIIYIDPLGHDYERVDTPATDTAKGYTTFTCSRCQDSYVMTHTPAVPNNCTCEGNLEYWKRSTDSKYFLDIWCEQETTLQAVSLAKDPSVHVGEWESIQKATCTKEGIEKRTCTECGTEETRITDAAGHRYETQIVKPTCTDSGYTVYSCSVCGHTYRDDFVEETGHFWGKWTEVRAATCTEKGEHYHTCDTCKITVTEDIPAMGHNFDILWTWDGYQLATVQLSCKNNAAHTYSPEVTVTAESNLEDCTLGGQTVYTATATVDGVVYTDTKSVLIPAGEHNIISLPAVDGTCQTEGQTEGKKCSTCQVVIKQQQATGYGDHVDNNYDGICDYCSTKLEEVISINNEAQLKMVVNNLTATYVLKTDITLSEPWVAIGTKDAPFSGKFHGAGHKVKNLTYTTSTEAYGLFVCNRGTIDGLTLENCTIVYSPDNGVTSAHPVCGGIAAYNYGTIDNCQIKGTFTAEMGCNAYVNNGRASFAYTFDFGAICGVNYGTVKNCNISANSAANVNAYCKSESGFLHVGNSICSANVTANFGTVAGRNFGKICDTSVRGTHNVVLNAETYTKNGGDEASVTLNAYAGSFVGVNTEQGEISNCSSVKCKVTKQQNTQSGGTVSCNAVEDQLYVGMLAQNNGKVEGLNIIY